MDNIGDPTVTLMQVLVDATFTGERWEGTNADIFEYLASLGKMPWPMRMSVKCAGGEIILNPEQPDFRTEAGVWIPSVQWFEVERRIGARCVGELFVKPCKEAITVAIVQEQVAEGVREMAAMMERFKDVPYQSVGDPATDRT